MRASVTQTLAVVICLSLSTNSSLWESLVEAMLQWLGSDEIPASKPTTGSILFGLFGSVDRDWFENLVTFFFPRP